MSRELYKDDKYFEDFIIYQNKRIEKFRDVLKNLGDKDVSKVKQCQRYLADFYRDLMSAKYSIGASKQEVQRYYLKYSDAVAHCAVSSYAEMVDLLSLAILFDISADDMKFILEYVEYNDDDLVCVLKGKVQDYGQVEGSNHLLFPEQYDIFYKYIKDNMDTERFLSYMENEWYSSCRDFAWFDSHKSLENIYTGYWSWLAGAVLKIKSVPVTDKRYIPCELL